MYCTCHSVSDSSFRMERLLTGFTGPLFIYWNVTESKLTDLKRNNGCYYSIRAIFPSVLIVRKCGYHMLLMCRIVLLNRCTKVQT